MFLRKILVRVTNVAGFGIGCVEADNRIVREEIVIALYCSSSAKVTHICTVVGGIVCEKEEDTMMYYVFS